MIFVIKVGTNVLANDSYEIRDEKISAMIDQIGRLMKAGHKVVLVSSGAVGSGRARLTDLRMAHKKQIWAAVGQPMLMERYNHFGRAKKLATAQCLVLRHDFSERERYDNFVLTLSGLLQAGALPIINENDVMATEDLTVGDNDLLSAMVAVAIGADKLILLTNQRGLFTSNPDKDSSAELIETVKNVDFELEKLCSKEISEGGRGGMLSKVRAAKHAVNAGIEAHILDGREPDAIDKLLSGDKIGTRFPAKPVAYVSGQKRWLLSAKGFGQIIIDDGAAKALGQNKSLLFPGIIGVRGMFDPKEVVEVVGRRGDAVAYGKVNFGSEALKNLLIEKNRGKKKVKLDKEIIHCDYLVKF